MDHEDNHTRHDGIQWTLLTQLNGLDFADNLAALSHYHSKMQYKTTHLASTFNLLQNILASKNIFITTRFRILNSNVKSKAETWRTAKTTLQKIKTVYNTCLRLIFTIQWPERIKNEELLKRAGQEPMDIQIDWGTGTGHTQRKPPSSTTGHVMSWNLQRKRKRAETPEGVVELNAQNKTWHDAAKAAQNRIR